MPDPTEHKKIYIVLSQTGTIVSRLIKMITRKEFSHASISLSADLCWMYSFGRTNPYNPFVAGFVREAPHIGTFKRFSKARILVMEVEVTPESLEGVRKTIGEMLSEQGKYNYNYKGLFKAAVHKTHPKREYLYYCSEFVMDVLTKNNVISRSDLPEIVHPVNFMELDWNVVYKGSLSEYCS